MEPNTASLHVDSMFYALNPTGRYQKLHLLLVSLGIVPTLIQLLDNVFIGSSVDQICAQPESNFTATSLYRNISDWVVSPNTTVTFEECSIRVVKGEKNVLHEESCPYGYRYSRPAAESVVSQLDLVCDKEHLMRLAQMLTFGGQSVGAMIGPFFSDRYGRKKAMAFSNLLMLALGFMVALSPNYAFFAISKFIIGALQQSVYIPVSIYQGEILPTDYRRYSIIISTVSWSFSGITMTLVAFLMKGQSWRFLQAVLSLTSLGAVVQLCFMDESIVWLLANNKREEALKVIRRAARWNKKDFKTVLQAGYSRLPADVAAKAVKVATLDLVESSSNSSCPEEADNEKMTTLLGANGEHVPQVEVSAPQKMSFIHILRVRRLFVNAMAMWVTWLSASLCYFTLYLMMSSLAGDKYLNYLLTSLMDIPACFIFFFGFNRFGRRSVTILLYAILAIGTFTLGLLRHFTDTDESPWSVVTLIMSLVSIVGGSGCFFSIFFYLPELFPTNLRNQATGVASCFARIGSMMSPFMGALASVAIWLPGLVMAVCASIAIFLLTLLPETKDKELPQSIEEMETWYNEDKSDSRGDN